jgi:hypothetical protein
LRLIRDLKLAQECDGLFDSAEGLEFNDIKEMFKVRWRITSGVVELGESYGIG